MDPLNLLEQAALGTFRKDAEEACELLGYKLEHGEGLLAVIPRMVADIQRQNAVVAELRHQATGHWYDLADGQWVRYHCAECRELRAAVEGTKAAKP